MISYEIREFDDMTGTIKVECDNRIFIIKLPLNDQNLYPTGTQLDTFIRGFLPTDLSSNTEVKAVSNSEQFFNPTVNENDVVNGEVLSNKIDFRTVFMKSIQGSTNEKQL